MLSDISASLCNIEIIACYITNRASNKLHHVIRCPFSNTFEQIHFENLRTETVALLRLDHAEHDAKRYSLLEDIVSIAVHP